jgi:riboflavin synthase
MFTGIIEELGEVTAWQPSGDSARLTVRAPLAASDARHGDSISVSGVCLTVVDQGGDWFTADVMAESIAASTVGRLTAGDRVNIERAASLGDRLGGHLVQGHVDAVGHVVRRDPGDHWDVVTVSLPPDLAPYLVDKGSITVDGVSLTVVSTSLDPRTGEAAFTVSLIPETLQRTTLGFRRPGDPVNLEVDVIGKYVARQLDARLAHLAPSEGTRP